MTFAHYARIEVNCKTQQSEIRTKRGGMSKTKDNKSGNARWKLHCRMYRVFNTQIREIRTVHVGEGQ